MRKSEWPACASLIRSPPQHTSCIDVTIHVQSFKLLNFGDHCCRSKKFNNILSRGTLFTWFRFTFEYHYYIQGSTCTHVIVARP
jgi:hypothetical protein